MIWQWAAFILFTLFNIYISRRSLRDWHAHGFWRFFSWETITALILIHLPHWVENPLAWYQIISWVLLFGSIPFLIFGVSAMRRIGHSSHSRQGDDLYQFERTTSLITSGIFKYIRHPMYASLLLLAWGAFFKLPTLAGGILAVLSTIFLQLTALRDEAANLEYFGQPYQEYMQQTKRFIPFLF